MLYPIVEGMLGVHVVGPPRFSLVLFMFSVFFFSFPLAKSKVVNQYAKVWTATCIEALFHTHGFRLLWFPDQSLPFLLYPDRALLINPGGLKLRGPSMLFMFESI